MASGARRLWNHFDTGLLATVIGFDIRSVPVVRYQPTAASRISTTYNHTMYCVDDRPNGATHVRRNGATLKWQNWGSRRAIKLAFFTPFRNNIFYSFFAA